MRYWYVGAAAGEEAPVDSAAIAAVRESLSVLADEPVREARFPGIEFAFDAARGQYASIRVLEMLARVCPADGRRLLALTERDLYIPVLTFVFGQAQLNGKAAVMSLARLRQEFYGLPPNREVLIERARKEALHEVGHTLGLVHCAERACAMSLATNVRQIDQKLAAYCSGCGARVSGSSGSKT